MHELPHAPEFPANIEKLAQELITLADLDADIAIFMAVRQDQARHLRYGYSHSVYTALLCILMAQRMDWTAARIRVITLAALTMNASIADLQGQMASQDYPVLDRQRTQLRTHIPSIVPHCSPRQASPTPHGWRPFANTMNRVMAAATPGA